MDEMVRVKLENGSEATVTAEQADRLKLEVLDKPATDARGYALSDKPKVDLNPARSKYAGMKPEELVTFKYEDEGVATLEDGLYVLEDKLTDAAFVDRMARFVKASMQGWKYAEENPDEAAEIVLEHDETGAQTEEHQKRMMSEIAKLTAGSDGSLDPADYERTVKILMAGGSDPVISKAPEGAWTSAVTDAALKP